MLPTVLFRLFVSGTNGSRHENSLISKYTLVNTSEAGQGEIEIQTKSPSGQNLPVKVTENNDGHYHVEFTPNIPGQYKTSIHYGGEPIPNTPLINVVSATAVPKHDARASGNGLEYAQRGKESSFVVYCPTTPPNVQIERIDERGERVEPKIRSLGNNEWKVSYTVLSVGKYEIRASCPNRGPLPGSPWNISSLGITIY